MGEFARLPSGPLILASASKTRQALLGAAGIDFQCAPVSVDEATIRGSCAADDVDPLDVAVMLAEIKGKAACERTPPAPGQLLLSADQILSLDGVMFGKPATRDQAFGQLQRLQGQTHQLMTAAVIFRDGVRIWHHVETSTLQMRAMRDPDITAYLDVIGEAAFWGPGSYQLEGAGIHLFSRIDGGHTDILGLPMLQILAFLRGHGLTITPPGTAVPE
jgi:septum formation protein